MKLQSRYQPGLQPSKGGDWKMEFKVAHSHGYKQEASVPCHVEPSIVLLEFPPDMVAGLP